MDLRITLNPDWRDAGAAVRRVALVTGTGGIIGKVVLEEIAHTPDWRERALSRTSGDVSADLTDAETTRTAMQAARETTHLFYAAYEPGGGLAEEDRLTSAMLRNLFDGLNAVRAPLWRVVLNRGAKVYGVHLCPIRKPFYENDNPRPLSELLLYSRGRAAPPLGCGRAGVDDPAP